MDFRLLGEYECKLDAKGRFRVPSDLITQLGEPEDGKHEFVVNRGFEKCLMVYPKAVWDQITAEINALNLYDKKNRAFVRYFYRGAQRVALDSADRILVSKRLLQYAEAEKEVVLMAYQNRIEIWDKAI